MNRIVRPDVVAAVALAASLLVASVVRGQTPESPVATANPADAERIARDLEAVSAEIEQLAAQRDEFSREEAGLTPRHDALTRRAREELRLLYHCVQSAPLAMRAGPEALLEHAAHIEHMRRAVKNTLDQLATTDRRRVTVVVDEARVGTSVADAEARRETLEQQRHRAEALAGMGLGVTNGIPSEPIDSAGGTTVTMYGGGIGMQPSDGAGFADSAGHLLFPLAGRTEVRRARREGADGPGLEIVAPAGAPVRAVFAGRVAFADRYGAYGRIVIVDHGEHYYTVSANLGAIHVRVGDEVPAGAVLGTVGDDGRGPMLYFELRRGSDTVDPSPWLGM